MRLIAEQSRVSGLHRVRQTPEGSGAVSDKLLHNGPHEIRAAEFLEVTERTVIENLWRLGLGFVRRGVRHLGRRREGGRNP